MKNVPHNNKFLYSALNTFKPSDTIRFFEENGVPLVTERGNRVFPVSDHASDITKVLADKMKDLGVKVTFHCKVEDLIRKEDGSVGGVITSKREKKEDWTTYIPQCLLPNPPNKEIILLKAEARRLTHLVIYALPNEFPSLENLKPNKVVPPQQLLG